MHNHHWDCNELPPARARMLVRGPQGKQGEDGKPGEQGEAGMSAYQGAREAGYTGTEAQFYGELGSLGQYIAEAQRAEREAETAKTQAADAAKKAEAAQSTAEYYAQKAAISQTAAENATSVLDGIKDAINNIPEGAATPIVNDLTTGGTSMALSAEMGKVLGQRPNPNLLDNWYFGNPVNQRGQTEYTAAGYIIDRWKISGTNITATVKDAGLALVSAADTTTYLLQLLSADFVEKLKGATVTFSVVADGILYTASKTVPTTENSSTQQVGTPFGGLRLYMYANGILGVTIDISAGKSTNINAVKLELGTEQTLAHQDENGNWVLNEIPDYNEQLLRCCMSTADSSDTYANNKVTPAAINAVNSVAVDISNTNLLDTLKSGFYRGQNVTNAPTTGWWYFVVICNATGTFATIIAINLWNSSDVRVARWESPQTAISSWPKLATTDYAVNKAGDTMKNGAKLIFPYGDGTGGVIWSTSSGLVLQSLSDAANPNSDRTTLKIHPDGALEYINVADGVSTNRTILHTGNKPSGSYTGNGSAASRTIETGGIGRLCVINGYGNSCLVTLNGGFYWNYNTETLIRLKRSEVQFNSGILTISTDNAAINANGLTYTYDIY